MKVKAQVGALRSAVEQVQLTLDNKIPLYSGIFFRATTDGSGKGCVEMFSLKMGAKTLLTIPAEVEETGAAVIRPEHLASALKGQDDKALVQFFMGSDRKRVSGTCGKSRFKIGTMPGGEGQMADHIKKLPLHGTNGSRYNATLLAEVLHKALWCTNTPGENALDAMEFKKTPHGFVAYATDRVVCVRVDVKSDLNPAQMTVERVPFEALAKMLNKQPEDEVHIIKGDLDKGEYNEMYFAFGQLFFGASTSTKKLPNVEGIFSDPMRQPTHVVIMSRTLLKTALERVAGFADRSNPIINITIDDNRLIISAASSEGDCVDEFEIAYAGHSPRKNGVTEVNVSYAYLAKILSSISHDLITLGVRDDMNPLIVSDEGNDDVNTRYMLMCIRPPAPTKAPEEKHEKQDDTIPASAGDGA